MKYILSFIGFLFLAPQVFAYEVEEDFSSFNASVTTSLVWDYTDERLAVPIQIKDYITSSSVTLSVNIDLGDASEGAFDSTTYSDFSENGDVSGNTITINTDDNPNLEVSSFHLESGWTLKGTGSEPLRIYSHGDVIIEGVIDCSGEDGEEFVDAATRAAVGGTGACGGGDGGDGASSLAGGEATDGVFGGVTVPGGGAGGVDGPSAGAGASGQTSGSGGGGGGAYTETTGGRDATDGDSIGAGTGGADGEVGEDHNFTYEGGGAGGGGGAAYTAGGAGQNGSGGGGGGGGGVIYIHALGKVEIYPTGGVYANGGDGGGTSSAATYLSGGGGGGGGGSIRIVALDEVYSSGPVEADSGAGGDNGSAGGAGGKGAEGRTWVVGKSGFSVALPPHGLVAESPASLLGDVGATTYQTGTFEWTSEVYDTLSTSPVISESSIASTLTGSSTATLQFAFSEEESGGFSNFAEASSVEGVDQSRYLIYRVQIVNDDETNGAEVSEASFVVTPFVQNDFEFKGGCGRVNFPGESAPQPWQILLLSVVLFIPIFQAFLLRAYPKIPRSRREEEAV